MADEDDDWTYRPAPMTAVAVRIEEAEVAAVKELAASDGLTAAQLMRRWVLQRLDAERNPPQETAAEPQQSPKSTKKVTAPTKKRAPATKPRAAKRKPAAKRS